MTSCIFSFLGILGQATAIESSLIRKTRLQRNTIFGRYSGSDLLVHIVNSCEGLFPMKLKSYKDKLEFYY